MSCVPRLMASPSAHVAVISGNSFPSLPSILLDTAEELRVTPDDVRQAQQQNQHNIALVESEWTTLQGAMHEMLVRMTYYTQSQSKIDQKLVKARTIQMEKETLTAQNVARERASHRKEKEKKEWEDATHREYEKYLFMLFMIGDAHRRKLKTEEDMNKRRKELEALRTSQKEKRELMEEELQRVTLLESKVHDQKKTLADSKSELHQLKQALQPEADGESARKLLLHNKIHDWFAVRLGEYSQLMEKIGSCQNPTCRTPYTKPDVDEYVCGTLQHLTEDITQQYINDQGRNSEVEEPNPDLEQQEEVSSIEEERKSVTPSVEGASEQEGDEVMSPLQQQPPQHRQQRRPAPYQQYQQQQCTILSQEILEEPRQLPSYFRTPAPQPRPASRTR